MTQALLVSPASATTTLAPPTGLSAYLAETSQNSKYPFFWVWFFTNPASGSTQQIEIDYSIGGSAYQPLTYSPSLGATYADTLTGNLAAGLAVSFQARGCTITTNTTTVAYQKASSSTSPYTNNGDGTKSITYTSYDDIAGDSLHSTKTVTTVISTIAASNTVTYVVPSSTFSPPSNVKGTVVNDGQINVTWTDNATQGEAVEVWVVPQTTGIPTYYGDVWFYQTKQMNVTGLAPGTGYQFKLRSFQLDQYGGRTYTNFSANSPTATTKAFNPATEAPTGLYIYTSSINSLMLVWTPNCPSATGYQILQRPSGGGPFTAVQTISPASYYTTVGNLPPNSSLDFAVQAVYSSGNTTLTTGTSNFVTLQTPNAITSPHYVQTVVNTPNFNYTITTTNGQPVTSMSVSGTLPAGLTFDGTSSITGSPTATTNGGVAQVAMTANFADGTSDSELLAIQVLAQPQVSDPSPLPASQSLAAGQSVNFQIAGTGIFTDSEESSAVKVSTSLGDMNFILFNSTPNTVSDFLGYLSSGNYIGNLFHRSVYNFVIQGGNFKINSYPDQFTQLPNPNAVNTEAATSGISNFLGTVALALTSDSYGNTYPNSGSNQFFINLDNNGLSSSVYQTKNGQGLDSQNFTAFARVAGNGMSVASAIANLPVTTYNIGVQFPAVPNCTLVTTSSTVTLLPTVDVSNVSVGAYVSGPGIPAGTQVVSVNDYKDSTGAVTSLTISLSNKPTAANAAASLTFTSTTNGFASWPMNADNAPPQMNAGQVVSINQITQLSDVFTYSASSDHPEFATASLVNGNLTVTAVAPGSANVTVTATDLDGVSVSTTIQVNVGDSSDATLADIQLTSGSLSPAFSPDQLGYTAIVSNALPAVGITPVVNQPGATVQVNGAPVAAGDFATISLSGGGGFATIVVTAQDNSTSKTYTVNFTPVPPSSILPTVTTLPASGVTATSATLNGNVNGNGASATLSFSWGTTTNYGNTITPTPASTPGTSASSMSATLVGLQPSTTYYYQAVAVGPTGQAINGSVGSFTTPSNIAALTSLSVPGLTLSPSFNSAVNSYSASVINATDSIHIAPLAAAGETVLINGSTNPNVSLAPGANTITIQVIAADGTTTNTYTLNVTRQLMTPVVTTLSASALSATSATLNGMVNANGSPATVTIDYGPTTAYGSSLTPTPSSISGSGPISLNASLTALPSATSYHYRVRAINANGTTLGGDVLFTTYSTVSTLSKLVVNGFTISPAFAANVTSYSTTVPFATNSVTLTPTTTQANARITVNGISVNSGSASSAVSLNVGSNTAYVTTIAQDGINYTNYLVNITRLPQVPIATTMQPQTVRATSATLEGYVNPNGQSASASFDFGPTTAYGANYPAGNYSFGDSSLHQVAYTVTGLTPGTTYHYRTNASNPTGVTTGTDVYFTTWSTDNTLSNIKLSSGTLSPAFNSGVTNYTATVSANTATVTVTPTLSQANATLVVNGVNYPSGVGVPVALSSGTNTISISVYPQDTNTAPQIYSIVVTQAVLPTVTTLGPATSLTATGATLSASVNANGFNTTPTFNYGLTTTYGSTIAASPTPLTGTSPATATANLTGLKPGTIYHYQAVASSPAGTVTGADATFTTPGNVATLSALALSSGSISPGLSATNTTYSATVANTVTSITLKPTATQSGATIKVNGTPVPSGTATTAQSLDVGPNAFTIVVTAVDGTTTLTYNLTVTRTAVVPTVTTVAASGVSPTAATMNGTVNSNGQSTTTSFDYGTTTAYGGTIAATPSPVTGSTATSISAALSSLTPGTLYHFRAHAVNATGTATGADMTFTTISSTTTLSNLVLSGGAALSPAFSSANTIYSATVSNALSSITVTPTVSASGATVQVNGTTVKSATASGAITLAPTPATNTLTVVVTAPDGSTTGTYTVAIVRAVPPTVSTLPAAAVNAAGATFNGSINANGASTTATFDYGTTTAYGSSAAATPTSVTGSSGSAVTAILSNLSPGVTYHYRARGVSPGGTVTGADATFTTTTNVATLSKLVVNTAALSPAFATTTSAYTATVSNATTSVTLTPTVTQTGATITVNGSSAASGSASAAVNLSLGPNPIPVVVTSSDGITVKTYIVTVTRSATAPAVVTVGATNGGASSPTSETLSGTINANNADTTASFDYGLTTSYGNNVAATPSPVTGATVTSTSAVISGLTPGATYHYRAKGVSVAGTVNGADKTFVVPSNIATLSSLTSSAGALTPVFNSTTMSYSVTVPAATTSVTFTPKVTQTGATVTVNGAATPSAQVASAAVSSSNPGTNTTNIVVTAPDGVTTQTYSVNVTVAPLPTVTQLQSSNVTTTGATLSGQLNPNNYSTTATFNYGTSTAYGKTVSASTTALTGNSAVPLSVNLTGLTPGTTYYYDLAGVSVAGTGVGTASFTTVSNVPTLSGLTLSTGSLNQTVSSATTSYTATVPYGTNSITVTPVLPTTATQPAESVTVAGVTVGSGNPSQSINLNVGANPAIPVVVTAPDGVTKKTYNIVITQSPGLATLMNPSATLSGPNGVTFAGTVNANGSSTTPYFDYGLTASYGSSVAAKPTPITGTTDTPVSAAVTNLTPGTTYHYRLRAVNAAGTDTTADGAFTTLGLTSLKASAGTLAPTFSAAVASYSISLPSTTASITLTPTTTANVASMTVNGVSVSSGNPSGAINLSPGLNVIPIVLTGQDGVTTTTYNVGVTQIAAPVPTTLPATPGTATAATFNGTVNAMGSATSVTFNYGTTTSYGSSVNATPSSVNGQSVTPVSAALSTLTPGTTYHYQVKAVSTGGAVTGADTSFSTPSNVATLATLALNTGTLSPAFSSSTTNYSVTVANGTASIVITPTVTSVYSGAALATVTVGGVAVPYLASSNAISLNAGPNVIPIVVTAQDGITTKTYTLTVTRTAQLATVTTGTASQGNLNGATLNGTVNANNGSTTVSFDYGLTTSYGSNIAAQPSVLNGNSATAVSAPLSGLTPGATYHFRAKGVNVAGTANGADATFTTVSLSALKLSAGSLTPALTPAFSPGVQLYTATVSASTPSVTVTPTVSQATTESVTVNGVPVTSGTASGGISLNPGTNTISVVVSGSNGAAAQTYVLNVTQGVAPTVSVTGSPTVAGTTASIAGTVNSQGYDATTSLSYGTTTAYGKTATVTPATVTGTSDNPVTASLTGLTPGTLYYYSLSATNTGGPTAVTGSFTTLSNNATLTGLTVSSGTLSPAFSSSAVTYSATVTNTTPSVIVTATPAANASVTVNGGASGATIALTAGANIIPIVVTAQDGVTTKTYNLTVTRTAVAPTGSTGSASNVLATSAAISGSLIANNAVTTASFDYGTSTAYGSTATASPATVNGDGVTSNSVSAALANLTPGTLYYFRVHATSVGGTFLGTAGTFTTPSNNANLSGLTLSAGTQAIALSPAFAAATTTYNVTVPAAGPTVSTYVPSGLSSPNGMAFDAAGNLYVANATDGTITQITPTGNASAFASGLSIPAKMVFDAAGNLYVSNSGNNTVSLITSTGAVSTYASGFNAPVGLAFDSAGNLYVANQSGNSISKVAPGGSVSTFASGTSFNQPTGLAIDAAGNLYVANYGANNALKVTPAAAVSTYGASLSGPSDVALDAAGNLYVSNQKSTTVSKIASGTVSTYATGFTTPTGLALDTSGNLYISNATPNTVSQASSAVTVTPTLSQSGATVLVNGSATLSGKPSAPITLGLGATPITVQVTAQDGLTVQTYTIIATRPANEPLVSTAPATAVSSMQATLNGMVTANGSSATPTFEFGTTTAYGSTITATPASVSGFTSNAVSATPTGLIPDTVYHYRVDASNAGGLTTGADMTFTTGLGNAATLASLGLSAGSLDQTFDPATTTYTATVPPSATTLTVTPTATQSQAPIQVNGTSVTSGTASGAITLNSGSSTVITIGVTSEDGTATDSYTITVNHATAPTVVTGSATSITATSAVVSGTVTANGFSSTPSFNFSTDSTFSSNVTNVAASPSPVTGATATSVSASLTGLSPLTTYYYQVQGAGIGGTVTDSGGSFTTLSYTGAWRQANFGTSANTGSAADTASYAGDGIANLVKYGFGLNPLNVASPAAVLPVPVHNTTNPLLSDRLALSFTLPVPAPTDIYYVVESSSDGQNWSGIAYLSYSMLGNNMQLIAQWAAPGVSSRIVQTNGANSSAFLIGDSVPTAGNPCRFMRIQVVSTNDDAVANTPAVTSATFTSPAGSTLVVPSVVNAPVYAGPATISSTAATPASTPNWTADAYDQTNLASPTPNYPTYYLEITSGAYAGYTLDVVSNTTSSLTLASDQIPAPLVGQTVSIALHAHFTLDQLAASSSGLQATTDYVTLNNSDGSTSKRTFNGTSWVAEDGTSAAGQSIIYPGNGVLLTTANGATLNFMGFVKTTPTAIPLYSGMINLVGPVNPTTSLPLVNLNLASALTTATDSFGTFSVDGNLSLLSSYYSNGTSLLSSEGGPTLPANDTTDVIKGNTGIQLNLSNTTFWICPGVTISP